MTEKAACRDCAHFRNDPAFIEATVAGLTSFSSGDASVRADDGICTHHDRYLSGDFRCADHTARESIVRPSRIML